MKISVRREGREGVYLADRASLKAWIESQGFEEIHNFSPVGPMLIGADHPVEGVLDDIDQAERIGILTGDARKGNVYHALALVMPADAGTANGRPARLEIYDIGEVVEEDLDILAESPA